MCNQMSFFCRTEAGEGSRAFDSQYWGLLMRITAIKADALNLFCSETLSFAHRVRRVCLLHQVCIVALSPDHL